jgi:hypothetical protein
MFGAQQDTNTDDYIQTFHFSQIITGVDVPV